MTEKNLKEEVRKSLVKQLENMGADLDLFVDLVDKYIEFWDIDRMLTRDIKDRGVMFVDVSASGHEMMKNNPSVKEKVMVNRQMLSILAQLKVSTESIEKEGEFDL